MPAFATQRLQHGDEANARQLFAMMASVFEEDAAPLSDVYLTRLLRRPDFWAIAAVADGDIIGGVTAHTLPMTTTESAELFIYDVAVRADWQRRGVGRQLIETLRAAAAQAGITDLFVPADTEDVHALDFYRAIGGAPTPVVMFTFAAKTP
jgi:aminoglycoside 3-N-acetyltransferase I